jgi:peptide deformylase
MTDEILVYPDPRLRQKALPVAEITPEIRERALGLVQVMNAGGEDGSGGIGLAATQVGWPVRIMVVKVEQEDREEDVILVNPCVMSSGGGRETEIEGCLSFPGIRVKVERDREVAVEAQDLDGKRFFLAATGIVARCLQHEADHLDGLMMIDRLTPARRAGIRGKLKALERRSRGI